MVHHNAILAASKLLRSDIFHLSPVGKYVLSRLILRDDNPPTSDLARLMGMSHTTLQKALRELCREREPFARRDRSGYVMRKKIYGSNDMDARGRPRDQLTVAVDVVPTLLNLGGVMPLEKCRLIHGILGTSGETRWAKFAMGNEGHEASDKLSWEQAYLLATLWAMADDDAVVWDVGINDVSAITGMKQKRISTLFSQLVSKKLLVKILSPIDDGQLFNPFAGALYLEINHSLLQRLDIKLKSNTVFFFSSDGFINENIENKLFEMRNARKNMLKSSISFRRNRKNRVLTSTVRNVFVKSREKYAMKKEELFSPALIGISYMEDIFLSEEMREVANSWHPYIFRLLANADQKVCKFLLFYQLRLAGKYVSRYGIDGIGSVQKVDCEIYSLIRSTLFISKRISSDFAFDQLVVWFYGCVIDMARILALIIKFSINENNHVSFYNFEMFRFTPENLLSFSVLSWSYDSFEHRMKKFKIDL